ncbi:hypothetical protein AUO94_07250 [Planococcus kocurii]|uniref:Peptidase C39-like domain-containing protein n=1 Tax=Planococcus kocurii TaxID=1374 RepID=A0ABM5WVW9_9BACL|nr:hypothetical protein [Planococcus kocurii]ALS78469.1 hypothetical protein AUO94_07250 [Planococcus kocurii]
MKKLCWSIGIILIFVLPSHVFANTPENNHVSVEDAKKAVEAFIEVEFPSEFDQGKVVYKEDLYDLDESTIAYFFTIEGASSEGFFLVSAVNTLNPMLEYGVGSDLTETFSEREKGEKAYYFGVDKFMFGMDAKDILKKFNEKKNKAKNLIKGEMKIKKSKNKDVTKLEKSLMEVEKSEVKSLNRKQKKSDGWDRLLDENQSTVSVASSTVTYKVLNVDRVCQYESNVTKPGSSCGPAVGAMILDYYHDERGINVIDNSPYTTYYRLINHLYNDMYTSAYGTSLNNWVGGMRAHFRESNIYKEGYSYINVFYVTYGDSLKYRNAITKNNPVAIRFEYFDLEGNGVNWHFVTGVGFNLNYQSSGNLAVMYKNPAGGVNNTGWRYFDWTSNDRDFGFAYFLF